VQHVGAKVDPGNALYRDMSVGIETIKFEAGNPPAVVYDPIARTGSTPRWISRTSCWRSSCAGADGPGALTDEDLVPNPMPALRSVEMFTVA
jgi:hypothetical protein